MGAAAPLFFVVLLALALAGWAAPAEGRSGEAGTGQARAADVAEIHAELEALDDEAFVVRVKALLEQRRIETARALVLRAGSDDPPGVSGARATRRSERRAEALALFEADVPVGGALFQELRDLLALRDPSADERDNCRAFLERELEILRRVRVVLAVGMIRQGDDDVVGCR